MPRTSTRPINARAAQSAALFTSAAGERGTWASTCVDAGLMTFSVCSAVEGLHAPSMKFCNRSVMFVFSSQVMALALARLFIVCTGFSDAVHFRDFGNRDVPPDRKSVV